ncbi:MAG TPA: DSD1 family PLP-dependent enzyme [Caulobacteraceae bacterium]|jgi:D-serine deaminase-like pyridoxal phosphate-dependent protein|nr:DSD1 family PLP-dependent enzyme [Caulobacteraceae bacterium]
MHAMELHGRLIGQQGSRAALNTPALVIEVDVLDRNIAAMAAFAAAAGLALRPHAKTHKSVEIARRQIAAGAAGVCCAKLGEAEVLAGGGIDGILITSPVVGPAAVARLAALAERCEGLIAAVDHPDALEAVIRSGARLKIVVDLDPGLHRTGVADAGAAVELARRVSEAPNLTYAGVQFYCGSQQHIETYAGRRAAIADRTRYLSEVIAALTAAGLAPPLVTGGGTGSHRIDAELGVLNELQVGSYVFMDRQYGDCELTDGATSQPFETSLFVDARVISASHPMLCTVDAGLKAFATEAGAPPIVSGAPAGSVYHFMGDEHGAIVPPRGAAPPKLGEVVTLAAPHCDPTVNLYEAFHVVQNGTLIDIWPVDGRGRSA